jgi:hypothetical protein
LVCDEWSVTQDITELDISDKDLQAADAILLGSVVSNNGALSSLVLKDNRLLTAEAGKVLSDMLATNTVLKVLDLSSNNWMQYGNFGDLMGDGPGFAKELAVGISGNGAITSLNLASNKLEAEGAKLIAACLPKCT